ncbi:hypothetical protein HN385_03475 [archaeon]|jgi:hypothetical protein|nr:hypothetical protein [archaeon]MBT3450692.1 hypothetical protein [archaeon]MBT6869757.1 hypothetical protein [archaeon]MBT7192712.1 hypothetical protein [archaeon]MBT7380737.1 hypothetical protein [archaeon]
MSRNFLRKRRSVEYLLKEDYNLEEKVNDLNYIFNFNNNFSKLTKWNIEDSLIYSFKRVLDDCFDDDEDLIKDKNKLIDWIGKTKYCLNFVDYDDDDNLHIMACELIKEIDLFNLLSKNDYLNLIKFERLCNIYLSGNNDSNSFYSSCYDIKHYDGLKELCCGILKEVKSLSEDVSIQKRILLGFTSDATRLFKEGKYDDFRLAIGGYC